jgi:DNA-binding PadR family transcriptional regulator
MYREMRMQDNAGVTTLSPTEYRIMSLLIGNGAKEMYGLEMVQKSEGKLKKGTIYVLLDRLEKKGFVKGRTEQATGVGIPRKLYKPTGLGRRAFNAWADVAAFRSLQGAST